jgi:hypothetical protein
MPPVGSFKAVAALAIVFGITGQSRAAPAAGHLATRHEARSESAREFANSVGSADVTAATHASCAPPGAPEAAAGYLEGRVTVGPLHPVARSSEAAPPVPPEVYTSRSIAVFKADRVTPVTEVRFKPDGTYRVSLPPGTYVVNYTPRGADAAEGLPATVIIRGNETVRLDIRIDTGIR